MLDIAFPRPEIAPRSVTILNAAFPIFENPLATAMPALLAIFELDAKLPIALDRDFTDDVALSALCRMFNVTSAITFYLSTFKCVFPGIEPFNQFTVVSFDLRLSLVIGGREDPNWFLNVFLLLLTECVVYRNRYGVVVVQTSHPQLLVHLFSTEPMCFPVRYCPPRFGIPKFVIGHAVDHV